MIEVKNLRKTYLLGKTEVHALRGVSFQVKKGEFVSIVGPSGSGKSTMLNIMGLLDKPTEGQVLVDDVDVTTVDTSGAAALRGQKIGFIFQSFNLIPVFNIFENVELSLTLSRAKMSSAQAADRIHQVIAEVGLGKYIKHKPNELSGGQRQRVAIARALVKQPEIIIADEPTANLDTENALSIIDLMKTLNRREKTTFIFSTHDDRVLKHIDRVVRLEDGMIKDVQ